MLAAIHLAAKRRTLQQNVFEPKAKTLLWHILTHRQFQLRLFHPKRPFQYGLHAQRAFYACAAIVDRPLQGHRTPRIRSRSGVTNPRASMASRVVLLIVLTGR